MIEHPGFVLWFTGLSGAGKTTLALALEKRLRERGIRFERLDGDTVLQRVTFVAKLLSRNNVGVLASFISPYGATRDFVRQETTNFIEVFVDAPLEVCAERDVKGLYAKAFAGEIENFTGVSDPYEAPDVPDIHIQTHEQTVDQSADQIIQWLEENDFIPAHVAM